MNYKSTLRTLLCAILNMALIGNLLLLLSAHHRKSSEVDEERKFGSARISKTETRDDPRQPANAKQSTTTERFVPGSLSQHYVLRLKKARKHSVVNPHNYTYRINPEDACKNRLVELLLCITVSTDEFDARHKFRDVLRDEHSMFWHPDVRIVFLFFVGVSVSRDSEAVHRRIQMEAKMHGDVVQSEIVDSKKNLSLKTMSVLKWVTNYCLAASYVLKSADDCEIDLASVLAELNKISADQSLFMLGKLANKKMIDANEKNEEAAIHYALYKVQEYPSYLYGSANAYPIAVAKLLYEAALRFPIFFMEDVFYSGICANFVSVPRYDSGAFYSNNCLTYDPS